MQNHNAQFKLLLMRHGEAEGHPDIDRQLTKNGREQCRSIGNALRAENLIPDLILTSSVLRAQESYAALNFTDIPHISCGLDLYTAHSVDDVLLTLQSLIPETTKRVLVIGHNPYIHETALYLGHKNPNAYLPLIAHHYAPATTTIISHSGATWADLHPVYCEIIGVMIPS